jgi:hypothetical protein
MAQDEADVKGKESMSIPRARKLCRRFFWAGFVVLVAATAAKFLGFDVFFMPLAVVCVICMSRASAWGGWVAGAIQGYETGQAACGRSHLP